MLAESPPPLCPECRHTLISATSQRCPECGWVIDPELLLVESSDGHTRWTFTVVLIGIFAGPALWAATRVLSNRGVPLAEIALYPFAYLTAALNYQLGFLVGLLQGPFYGFILGTRLPPHRFRSSWRLVGLLHLCVAVVALAVWAF